MKSKFTVGDINLRPIRSDFFNFPQFFFYAIKINTVNSRNYLHIYKLSATFNICFKSVAAYPHSLSYQDKTFTKSPSMTLVNFKSTIAPYGSPIISEETR